MPFSYYNPYQTPVYQPPMQDSLSQFRQNPYQTPAPQPGGNGNVWVSSQAEAAAYLMAPNSSVALWDSTAPYIYLKQTDASGKPTMKTYELVERTAQPPAVNNQAGEYVTRQEFDTLMGKVEALSKRAAHKGEKGGSDE